MDGVWEVARCFDTAGAMAKSVLELAEVSDIHLKTAKAPVNLPTPLTQFITDSWLGISVGFVDIEKWRIPPEAQNSLPEYLEQTVSFQHSYRLPRFTLL